MKLYFFCLAVFALAAVPASPVLALVEGVATVGLYVYFTQGNKKRRQGILQYIDTVTGSVDTASKSTLINSPLPIMVFRPDTGEVIWSNENFLQLAGVREQKDNRGSGPYCCQRSAAGIAAYHYGIRRVIGQLQEAGEHQGD